MSNMYVGKRRDKKKFQYWGLVVDLISIVLGIVTVLCTVYIAFMVEERLKWLPVVFLGAALVNLIEGLKKIYYGKFLAGILFFIAAVLVTAFAVISYISIWLG